MASRLTSWLARPLMLRALVGRLRLAGRLLREPVVPLGAKLFAALPLVYLVSPVDALPDIIPVLGQLDDLGVLLFALELFLRMVPADAVAHHQAAVNRRQPFAPMKKAGGPVIDAEWRAD